MAGPRCVRTAVALLVVLATSCSATEGGGTADSGPVRSVPSAPATTASAPADTPEPSAPPVPTTDAITAFEDELANAATIERLTDPAVLNESWSGVLLRGAGGDDEVIAAIEAVEAATLADARAELDALAAANPAAGTPTSSTAPPGTAPQGFRRRQDVGGGFALLTVLADGLGGFLAQGPAGRSSVTGQQTLPSGTIGSVTVGGSSDGNGDTTVQLTMEFTHTGDAGQTSSSSMSVEFTGPVCPPEDGIMKIEFIGSARGSLGGDGLTTQEFRGTVTGSFDDEGEVTSIDIEADVEAGRSGGSSGDSYVELALSVSHLDGSGGVTPSTSFDAPISRRSSRFDAGKPADEQMVMDAAKSAMALGLNVFVLRKHRAQNSGCVIVDAKAPSTVSAEQVVPIDVHTRHVVEGVELDKRVAATLSGAGSIDPDQLPRTSGTITYTAGEQSGDAGTITLESRSRRGIGRITLTITVQASYRIDQPVGDLYLSGPVCGLDKPFTLATAEPLPGAITFTPSGPGGGTYDGSAQMSGTASSMEWSGAYTIDATDAEHPTVRLEDGSTRITNVPVLGEAPVPSFWRGGVTLDLITDPAACSAA